MRNLRLILLTISLTLLSAMTVAQQEVDYNVRHITTASGLPSNTVRAMVQDAWGYMWFGGSDGLVRYNGNGFIRFNRLPHGVTSKNIGLLHLDEKQGLLWLSTSTYDYACYDLQRGRYLTFTGRPAREYSKRYMSSQGMWLWDSKIGLRHTELRDGQIHLTDYSEEQGNLPSSAAQRIAESKDGTIWVATTNGLARIAQGKTTTYLRGKNLKDVMVTDGHVVAYSHDDQTFYTLSLQGKRLKATSLEAQGHSIVTLRNALAWRGSCYYFTSHGVYVYNPATDIISRPDAVQMDDGYIQGDTDGYRLVGNASGRVMIFPPKGDIIHLNLNRGLRTTNEKKKIFSFATDRKGRLYIATYGMGLFIYNLGTRELEQHTAQEALPLVHSNYLLDVMVDHRGSVWVSEEGAGISQITPITDISASYYFVNQGTTGDWTNYVRLIFQGRDGQTYAATRDNNIYRFSQSTATFTKTATTSKGLYSVLNDREGHTWYLTRGDGIYIDGVQWGVKQKGRELPVNDYFDAVQDRKGRIWIASWQGGLLMMQWKDGRLTPYKQYLNGAYNERRLHDLELSPDGMLYIATFNGLYALDTRKANITDSDITAYNTQSGNFPSDEVKSLRYAHGRLWAGVAATGVVCCDFSKGSSSMHYTVYNTEAGLADNDVRTIAADHYGAIWVGSATGLSRINQGDGSVRRFFLSKNTLSNCFADNSAMELSDGQLLFGTEEGLLAVQPKMYVKPKQNAARVSISNIYIEGVSIYEQQDSTLLSSALNLTESISLSHNQNSLRIHCSDLSYRSEGATLYQTWLEGEDSDWGPATTGNVSTYTHLSPGTYIFHVRAFDGHTWGPETTLTITIRQPWWNSWWMWIVYLGIAAEVLYYIYSNAREKLRMKQQMRIDKELTEFRLSFFTHITHEFRTPLAIIQSGVYNILDPQTKQVQKVSLQTIQRGTKRLLRLVNQLMEFRRISTTGKKMRVGEGDVVNFVRDVWQDLWVVADQKRINYSFTPFERHYTMLFDHDVVETIVYNLLSNALKYTPTGGSVGLRMALTDGRLVVTVEDDGPGVDRAREKELFQPFMKGYASAGGMGIGLYTAHQLAASHHGGLVYERVAVEGGARFVLTLPVDASAYSDDELATATALTATEDAERHADEIIRQSNQPSLNEQMVAIIEDDTDMMQQMKEVVGYYFKTTGYTNGREGYEGILASPPSLVICDLMLPDMDGYEIVRRLKADPRMAHVPVIMLTALDDEAHQIKGYQAGADDYMVKPCNYRLLVARMIQLIKWKKQAAVTEQAEQAEASQPQAAQTEVRPAEEVVESRADKVFRESVERIISEHMGDATFSIDVLAEKMRMGRSSFYGKMKEIYGTSPNKYLLACRMEKAAYLLVEERLTVAEVSRAVGFQDPSHFNRCFKTRFGVVPSKYKG